MTSRAKPVPAPRTRGRPAAASGVEVRTALLQAARRLFLKHGYAKVTARQIAAAAQTTPAMIHYYFEDKDGLFRAMLNDAIQPLFGLVDGTGPGTLELEQLIRLQMQINAANPWIATLIVNEVFAGEGRLRTLFIREVASRMLPKLIALLTQAQALGRMRADLDPRLAALSLLSLNMFPFIARSVVTPVFDLKLEGSELESLIEHNTAFFLHAAGWSGGERGV
jgi:TetR/AcrR family transcriptional regulator